MRPAAADVPPFDVPDVVKFLVAQQTHPNWWAVHALTWEHLVKRLQWRYAKSLFEAYPDLVSMVVETLVAGRPGTQSDRDAWMCLGMVRRRRGDYEAAIAAFDHLWSRDRDIRAKYNIGLCHQAMGDIGEARAAFEAVLACKPNDERANAALAQLAA